MKIIVNEREIKEYFDGLARLLQPLPSDRTEPAVSNSIDTSAFMTELRQTIREELALIGHAVQREVGAYNVNKLRQAFGPYTGRSAELLTPAGTVEGTIVKVGTDYLVVHEQGGTSVMVPLEQLVAFQLTGKQVER